MWSPRFTPSTRATCRRRGTRYVGSAIPTGRGGFRSTGRPARSSTRWPPAARRPTAASGSARTAPRKAPESPATSPSVNAPRHWSRTSTPTMNSNPTRSSPQRRARHAGYAVGHARDLHADGTLHTLPLAVTAGPLARGALAVAWASALPDRTLPPVHPAGVMWRRTLLLAVGGWAALRGVEDTATLIAGSALATGILLDIPTLRYRRHDAQRSRQNGNFSGGGGNICSSGSAPHSSPQGIPGKTDNQRARRSRVARISQASRSAHAEWIDRPNGAPVRGMSSTPIPRPCALRLHGA